MLSEIVCSGARQKRRTTKGGTTATQATTIQFGTDVIPIAIAARHTAIDPGNEQQRLGIFGEHETSVATGNRARCSELHCVRRRGQGDVFQACPGPVTSVGGKDLLDV